jgi:Fe-S cluster biogenesis protein NfuA
MADDHDFRQRMQRVEGLIREVERWPDGAARAQTQEIVRAVLDMHGVGLEKILGHLAAAGEAGRALIDTLGQDDLVSSLLLLYGLHPLDLESRVRLALEKVRPYLRSHGGNVDLLGVDDGVVRVRLQGSCHSCPSSSATLRSAIEGAIFEKAPDVVRVEAEEVADPAEGNGRTRVALPLL